jgi:hypothetical protein
VAKAKRIEQTAKERVAAAELADRIKRARAKMPPSDPTGEHHAAIAEIARASGRDVVELLDLWDERAAIRQYEGCADRATAERDAVTDIAAQFAPMQGAFL